MIGYEVVVAHPESLGTGSRATRDVWGRDSASEIEYEADIAILYFLSLVPYSTNMRPACTCRRYHT